MGQIIFFYFQRKEEHVMDNFLNMGLGNYVVLEDITKNKILLRKYLMDIEAIFLWFFL